MMRLIFANSSIRFFLLCRRTAASQIITSAPTDFAFAMVSNTTEAGRTFVTFYHFPTCARFAQTSNCSIAAARNVSAAPKMTFFLLLQAQRHFTNGCGFLPTPLTPITTNRWFCLNMQLLIAANHFCNNNCLESYL